MRTFVLTSNHFFTFQVVLSACSPFFKRILLENPCKHPVILLPAEITSSDLKLVLDFCYSGEVDVPRSSLASVLRAAALLEIKGMRGEEVEMVAAAVENADEEAKICEEQDAIDGRQTEALDFRETSLHSIKRKSSPKFRFTKSKRKSSRPVRFGEDNLTAAAAAVADEGGEAGEEEEEEEELNSIKEEEPMDCSIKKSKYTPREEKAALRVDQPRDSPSKSRLLSLPNSFLYDSSGVSAPPAMPSHQVSSAFFGNGLPPFPPPPVSSVSDAERLLELESNDDIVVDVDGDCYVGGDRDPLSPSAGKVNYTKKEMNMALEALKLKHLSLSRASELYGIPATTLWQRANRLGISTPKNKEINSKAWSDYDLNSALTALRNKEISANKASKVYGIPSSTLYKIARKEGIELAQPFNAVQTTWTPQDLAKALESIRRGKAVQKAATEFGIPSGTLYGRCKKVGIELSKTAAVHTWSEDDMNNALDSVRSCGMSINQVRVRPWREIDLLSRFFFLFLQAAIHHNLPYSSLYGRINRLKKERPTEWNRFCEVDVEGSSGTTNDFGLLNAALHVSMLAAAEHHHQKSEETTRRRERRATANSQIRNGTT